MRPNFGCAIHDLVFWPNNSSLHGLAIQKVREALTQWEPRVDVGDVDVQTDPASPNQLFISIGYRLRGNNAWDNLVYPFYVQDQAG